MLSIGLKLFSKYFLVTGIAAITQFVWIFDTNGSDGVKTTQLIAITWYPVFVVIVGLLFTLKSKLIAYVVDNSEQMELTKSDVSINNILSLVGVFHFATSIWSFMKKCNPSICIRNRIYV